MVSKPCDTPYEVAAEEGEVIVEGRGVSMSLTPDAALESSDRLFQGGLAAHGQKVTARRKRGAPDQDA